MVCFKTSRGAVNTGHSAVLGAGRPWPQNQWKDSAGLGLGEGKYFKRKKGDSNACIFNNIKPHVIVCLGTLGTRKAFSVASLVSKLLKRMERPSKRDSAGVGPSRFCMCSVPGNGTGAGGGIRPRRTRKEQGVHGKHVTTA